MDTIVTGVFNDRPSAERAISTLLDRGVRDQDISYVYLDSADDVEVRSGTGEEAGAGAASGAGTGAVVGALAGLAVANGILPGLGSIFVAGPLAAALGLTGAAATTASGAVTGAVAGGLIGALTGLGIAESDAQRYEERIKEGGVLVVAGTNDVAGTDTIKDSLRESGADEVSVYND